MEKGRGGRGKEEKIEEVVGTGAACVKPRPVRQRRTRSDRRNNRVGPRGQQSVHFCLDQITKQPPSSSSAL